jgi:predicted 3-demethylubiquinone-9 3-methyltransferase (glyoxalase superfamily)
MKKAAVSLWYDSQAEDAAKYYAKIFKGTKIKKITRYPKGPMGPEGKVLTVEFTMLGLKFIGINGGPHFKFNPAISFVVTCKTQKEIDNYWSKLTADGGKEVQCGWCEDKYGMSWQIVPEQMGKFFSSKNKAATEAVNAAMLKMIKLDIKALKAAFDSAGKK